MLFIDYYTEIKEQLINNEITKKVKDYSKNRSDLTTYYNVGKLLSEAGKHYGEGIIKQYSYKLTNELGKKYSVTSLKYMRQFYRFQKSHALHDQLSWNHYKILLSLKDANKVNYYINISLMQNLSYRQLHDKIKNFEYERLDDETKNKLINNEETKVSDFIKNPILIKNSLNYDDISEKSLQKLILEDMDNFLTELGNGLCYVSHEYKINMGYSYNYIDILLFNYIYNCFTVVELKVTELKKEHIGQIQVYMNYIDKNIKTIYQDKTIGIIIVKKDNKFILEYSSDERIYETTYILN